MKTGFKKSELEKYRRLGLDAILSKTVTGFNYYPESIEKEARNLIHIPVKFGHRSIEFLNLLQTAVRKEFKDTVSKKIFSRKVIYHWLRTYAFPAPEERISIFDVETNAYIHNREEYSSASNKLLAEGDEQSLSFIPETAHTLVDLALFLESKGSFYLTDDNGELIPGAEGSEHPFELNPNRISDEAYMTPMIITSYDEDLESKLTSFCPVKKLFQIRGDEEISVYLDKTYNEFREKCRLDFEGPVLKLANRLFRDFINFEGFY
jgi:hypothetical protein